MPATAPMYRLVIFDRIDDPQELREMICRLTGMHPTDVVQWLARAPGVWPHPLEESVVRRAPRRALRGGGGGRSLEGRPVPRAQPGSHGPSGGLPG